MAPQHPEGKNAWHHLYRSILCCLVGAIICQVKHPPLIFKALPSPMGSWVVNVCVVVALQLPHVSGGSAPAELCNSFEEWICESIPICWCGAGSGGFLGQGAEHLCHRSCTGCSSQTGLWPVFSINWSSAEQSCLSLSGYQ